MDKKIIAVDFDGTLSKGRWPGVGVPNYLLIEKLLNLQKAGHKLILWTCREGEALHNAIEWCKEMNLVFDAINDNLPEVKEMYGNNSRKISCDIYIDDKFDKPFSHFRDCLTPLMQLKEGKWTIEKAIQYLDELRTEGYVDNSEYGLW